MKKGGLFFNAVRSFKLLVWDLGKLVFVLFPFFLILGGLYILYDYGIEYYLGKPFELVHIFYIVLAIIMVILGCGWMGVEDEEYQKIK